MNKNRPKFLALRLIRLPLPGLVSILHRVSGALLFLALPALLWLLQGSLHSAESYETVVGYLHLPLLKLVSIALLWALLHHLLAGLRFLAIDMGVGVKLGPARASSKAVLALGLVLTLLIGVRLW